jgi:hypothetical protein
MHLDVSRMNAVWKRGGCAPLGHHVAGVSRASVGPRGARARGLGLMRVEDRALLKDRVRAVFDFAEPGVS